MNRRKFLQLKGSLAMGALLTPSLGSFAFAEDLGYHKIAKISFGNVLLQWPRLVGKNARLDVHGRGPREEICTITTDKGATGWGTLRGKREAEAVKDQLIGKKLSEVFNPATGVLGDQYLPYDIALHDLAGIILKQPVYRMLGREQPLLFDCYSGMIYFDDLEPKENPAGLDKILEECQFDYDYGYRQFKLKIGRGNKWMEKKAGLARDIEVTKLVAKHFPDCDILVDGNNGFSVDEIMAYVKGIGEIELFWIEEPFHETVADYKQFNKELDAIGFKTLLADGEADPDQALLRTLCEQKLIDVHLTDIIGLGFTPWRKLMPQLERMGTLTSPHAWGSGLKTNYIAHLSGGLGNTVTIEGVTSASDDVDMSGYKMEKGKLVPPNRPGFGMELLKKI